MEIESGAVCVLGEHSTNGLLNQPPFLTRCFSVFIHSQSFLQRCLYGSSLDPRTCHLYLTGEGVPSTAHQDTFPFLIIAAQDSVALCPHSQTPWVCRREEAMASWQAGVIYRAVQCSFGKLIPTWFPFSGFPSYSRLGFCCLFILQGKPDRNICSLHFCKGCLWVSLLLREQCHIEPASLGTATTFFHAYVRDVQWETGRINSNPQGQNQTNSS